MKYTNKWLLALLPAAMLTSCADDVFEPYNVEMPASLAETQYLKDYNVLKEYAGNLNIGAVVDAGKYAGKSAVYGLAVSNFNEVSGGLSTMHVNMVRDNGSANTLNFLDMVSAAKAIQQPVFGSALLSNSDQNAKYLNSILQDKVDPNFVPQKQEITKHDDTKCVMTETTDKKEQNWDNQFWFVFKDTPAKSGDTWEYSMDVRANIETAIETQVHGDPDQSDRYIHWQGFGNLPFTTEWTTITGKGTFDDGGTGRDIMSVALNLSMCDKANSYYFKNVSIKINGVEAIKNGKLESPEDGSSFTSVKYGEAYGPAKIVDGFDYTVFDYAPTEVEIKYNKPCLVIHSQDKVADPWDSQFWLSFTDNPIKLGDTWECTMKIRADKAAKTTTQVHTDPSQPGNTYLYWGAIGDVNFTTEWTEFHQTGTFAEMYGSPEGGTSIAFNLNELDKANNYYFASISFKINGKEVVKNVDFKGSDNSNFWAKEAPSQDRVLCTIQPNASWIITKSTPGIPLTDEEKHDTINYALKSYIQSMMNASQGYVKNWDVLANVIGDDGAINAADGGNNFNWSEFLGEEDFARLAVKYAREYFAAAGGNASDLKLFINESGLDNETKLNGLKSWIAKWEADGTTKFDGISAVIKTSYSEDAATQTANEESVVKQLNALKEIGLPVRIAGIEMDYLDATGAAVKTASMTVEQGKKMGAFYAFIAKKYKEIIPNGYGLFISNITNNGDTPNGLWNENYSRNHQYGAFADGLK